MLCLSTLHTPMTGHRVAITPQPRALSATAHLAAIRQLETAGLLTAKEVERARKRAMRSYAKAREAMARQKDTEQ